MIPSIKVEVINPSDSPKKIVIGLHGWSGDEYSLRPVVNGINDKDITWHLIRAPYKIMTLKGYSWNSQDEVEQSVNQVSIGLITEHITALIDSGMKSKNIFLLGFSQGAFIAIHTALGVHYQLGGIVSIAGFASKSALATVKNPKNNTPFLLLHGKKDQIVSIEASEYIQSYLEKFNIESQLVIYNTGHKINVRGLEVIREFIYKNSNTDQE
jgi:phospholipase/carboxylesterase